MLRWWQQADQEREQLQVSLEAALEQNEEQSKFNHDLEDRLRTSRRQVSKLTAALAERDAELGRLKQSLREQGGGGSSLPSSSATVEEELRSALEELQITAEELQENNELLSQVNENLEERIAARTDELVRSNMGLQKALAERDFLLREVHHRVRNNMQTILSLLRLQARRMVPDIHPDFGNALRRIRAMAVAQELLYGADDLSRIDFATHLQTMAPLLLQTHGGDAERIRLDITVSPCIVDLDTATPLSLIVSEIMSNAVHHAFPGDKVGTIRISLEHAAVGCRLTIRDDGMGLPGALEDCQHQGLGLRLVQALVGELRADLQIVSDSGGSSVVITLLESNAAESI